ncbi:MAG: LD-carboxypeptidase [Cytophagaceae bacterium SCN 52-12]|mgnify:CR=1 FL=1|nr:MAG: LD-carboxypeptidase [Cytophagaceae bacterium SCN 52-12]
MIFPQPLQPGDKIGVVAPAGCISYPDDIADGLRMLAGWGLSVTEGRTPSLRYFQYAGTDEQRLADLQQMLDDPGIKAVIAVRGGYGCSRIIDRIDFSAFSRSPKWVIGFSDITLLLCHLEKLGYAGIHGPMVKQLGSEGSGEASESLRKILFGAPVRYEVGPHPMSRPGTASGQLAGGNLCLLAHSIGSFSETDTRGKILFLEDVGEQLYNLDRMMWQLGRAGKLSSLAGLIAGHFTENKGNPEVFGQDACEIIAGHVRGYGYPLLFGFPAGHVPDNRPLVIGKKTVVKVGENGASVSF